ncbi:MAG: ATP-binding protein, partial [Planctomycetes bacterium]|nr:ATP-binding protein [Planctomycetota bacterium]
VCGMAGVLPEVRRYPQLLLARESFDEERLGVFLDQLARGVIAVSEAEILFRAPRPYWARGYFHSRSTFSYQPGTLFQLEQTNRPTFDDSLHAPLLSYALPYAPEAWIAVAEWTGLPSFRQHSQSELGSALFFLPERRAWFDKVEREGEFLRLHVRCAKAHAEGLIVRGGWWLRHGAPSSFEARVRDGEARIGIPDEWENLHLYLIGPQDEVFDYHRQDPKGSAGHPAIPMTKEELASRTDAAIRSVQGGEGARVEFKPFIHLSSTKATEIARTVIAFANTEGGDLLFGVEKDCSVVGIEIDVMRHAPRPTPSLAECVEKYAGAIVSAIKDNVAPDLDIEATPVVIRNHSVLVVRVPRAATPPCYDVQSKRIWVRRGSNNVPADPAADLPQLYARASRLEPPIGSLGQLEV